MGSAAGVRVNLARRYFAYSSSHYAALKVSPITRPTGANMMIDTFNKEELAKMVVRLSEERTAGNVISLGAYRARISRKDATNRFWEALDHLNKARNILKEYPKLQVEVQNLLAWSVEKIRRECNNLP